ncbi:UNVERIFIED_CONTAM: hypothetical protein HDU68_010446 [Siphonaria sp. JEL0065]|nr:hypothetical protein HDU68_010446 [Siphonaria sp. JEL0065]
MKLTLTLLLVAGIDKSAATSVWRDVGCLYTIEPPYSSGELIIPAQNQVSVGIDDIGNNLVFVFANNYDFGKLDRANPMVQTYPGGIVTVSVTSTNAAGCGPVTLYNNTTLTSNACTSNARFPTYCFTRTESTGFTWEGDMAYHVAVPGKSLDAVKQFHASYTLLTYSENTTTATFTTSSTGNLNSGTGENSIVSFGLGLGAVLAWLLA